MTSPNVPRIVETLYQRIMEKPHLASYFEGREHPKRHMADLVRSILGDNGRYTGRTLKEAHAGLGITEADYWEVSEIFLEILENEPDLTDAQYLRIEEGLENAEYDIVEVKE